MNSNSFGVSDDLLSPSFSVHCEIIILSQWIYFADFMDTSFRNLRIQEEGLLTMDYV